MNKKIDQCIKNGYLCLAPLAVRKTKYLVKYHLYRVSVGLATHYIQCWIISSMLPINGNYDTLHAALSINDMDKICMTDIVFLRYLSDGIIHSGMLTIEFEYSSSHCSINYLDVIYSDPQMRKYVEGNPNVLRNIDSYLRNNLLYQEYSIN